MTIKTHRVITWQVILYPGSVKSLARPKSAIFRWPSEEMSKLFGFKSWIGHEEQVASLDKNIRGVGRGFCDRIRGHEMSWPSSF